MATPFPLAYDTLAEQTRFDSICSDLIAQGISVQRNFFSAQLTHALLQEVSEAQTLQSAGVGQGFGYQLNTAIRKDQISWINGDTDAQRDYLQFMDTLKQSLNQQLMLALFEYECHFAHYPPGAFYKKHFDGFQHKRARLVTTVSYLNPTWSSEFGGALRVYDPRNHDQSLDDVMPEGGTLVVFLSEEVPHEVLPTLRDRYSIAGWFRMRAMQSAFHRYSFSTAGG